MKVSVPKGNGVRDEVEVEEAETATFDEANGSLPSMSDLPRTQIDLTTEDDDTGAASTNGRSTEATNRGSPTAGGGHSINAQASSSRLHTPLGPSTSDYSHYLQDPSHHPALHSTQTSSSGPYSASVSARPSYQPADDDNDIQITGSKLVSPQIQRSYSGMTNGSYQNGLAMSGNGANAPGTNGYTADSAIDLTDVRLPSPPPVKDTKKPICIGAVQSRAIVLYPSPAIVAGASPPPHVKEKFSTLMFNGAELIKAKLKVGRTMIENG